MAPRKLAGQFLIARCKVEPVLNRISRDSLVVVVEPKVMELLVALAGRPDHVFSRDELIEEVWDGRAISDEAVNRAIFELRKAFREVGVQREVIATVRKRGYLLRRQPRPSAPRPVSRAAAVWASIATLAALFVAGSAMFAWKDDGGPTGRGQPKSDIVLNLQPIVIRDGEGQADALSQLLTERLGGVLKTQPGLLVRQSRRVHDEAMPELPKELQPDLELRGELSVHERQPEVRVELRDRRGEELWSESIQFQPTAAGIGAASQRVAAAVSRMLAAPLETWEACPWPDDLELLASYFEARRLISLRGNGPLREAAERLESVVAAQPDFAQAWTALAWVYQLLPVYAGDDAGTARVAAEVTPLMEHAARRALLLCDDQAQAYLLVGEPGEYTGTHELIAYDYKLRHALKLDPGNAEVSRHYADILYRWGRLEESRDWMARALNLDPFNARAFRDIAEQALDQGRIREAGEYLDSADRLGYSGPRHTWWRLAVLSGDGEALIAEVSAELVPAAQALAQSLKMPDDPELRRLAVEALDDLRDAGMRDGLVLAHFGGLWLVDNDLAWDAWEDIPRRNSNFHSAWWPESAAFRADPRFSSFWESFQLLEYWRHFGPPSRCEPTLDHLVCPEPS